MGRTRPGSTAPVPLRETALRCTPCTSQRRRFTLADTARRLAESVVVFGSRQRALPSRQGASDRGDFRGDEQHSSADCHGMSPWRMPPAAMHRPQASE